MNNFCTLFDSNYLPRALAMYHSLEATGDDFRLYVICFDDLAYQILLKLNFSNLVAIPLTDFENPDLLLVKPTRTAAEYCWTCTPHVIRFILDRYQLPQVTYVDADLCFYASPSLLLEEFRLAKASVLITEHRYTPIYDFTSSAGIYCVQFMTFNADAHGLKVLQWWQDRCLEWCYARLEDGKFGDQMYLNDWPTRFEGIHVLEHLGGGVAPWNVQQYQVSKIENQLYVNASPIVFYHFQNYKFYKNGIHDCVGSCRLNKAVVDLLYRPYGLAILDAYIEITGVAPDFDRGWAVRPAFWEGIMIYLKRVLRGCFNEYRVKPKS